MSMMAAMAAASHMALPRHDARYDGVVGLPLSPSAVALEFGFQLPPASPFDARAPRSVPKCIPQVERARRKRKEKIAAKSRKRNRK
jgi:hypothetical protein